MIRTLRLLAAGILSVSLSLPAFAHDETPHLAQLLPAVDPLTQTVDPDDCATDPCVAHHRESHLHWHGGRTEEDDLEESQRSAE
jgi:hypothetical protein